MGKILAAIDIGSHTARLLVAKESKVGGVIQQLARKRAYIHLAEGIAQSEKKILPSRAMERALNALKDFSGYINRLGVHSVRAVATGVVREAANKKQFLDRIYEQTGIRVRAITGVEEAYLSAKGALHALNIHTDPFVVFDLGGGSTEFFIRSEGTKVARSVPLGTMILTKRYLGFDPPREAEVEALVRHVDQCLLDANLDVPSVRDLSLMVGTGGTVTTLAAMVHGISLGDITAERINGLVLGRRKIEALFNEIRPLSLDSRSRLPGLDKGRSDVILAGCLAVIRILYFFKSLQLRVSLSDLLEGMLIENNNGEGND